MRAVYTNCFGAPEADLLLTEELGVAEAAQREALIVDRLIDPDRAEAANIRMWDLAFNWATIGGPDPTVIDGVSAADLGGGEMVLHALLPAARGCLGMLSAIEAGSRFSALETVTAADGSARYRATERIQAEAARAAAVDRFGASLTTTDSTATDPRNAGLFAKYAATRDVDAFAIRDQGSQGARKFITRALNGLAGLSRRRRTHTALVYEYNPTRAFADTYAADRSRHWRLVRHGFGRAAIPSAIRSGDRLFLPPAFPRPGDVPDMPEAWRAAFAEREDALCRAFSLESVSLWPVVRPFLLDAARRHAALVSSGADVVRRQLTGFHVDAVLVPFESPPEARLILRVAENLGIPTLVLSDGFKADDFTVDGMLADQALSWSESMATHYFRRRSHGRVTATGNPKADGQKALRRLTTEDAGSADLPVIIGTHTFSPADVNCRRSDAEIMLEQALLGIRSSGRCRASPIVVKLHPADRIEHYASILARHQGVRIVREGDIVEMFTSCAIYITTYSTSLIEAVPLGVPVIYFRVNEQRLHPPFSDDRWLAERTATDGPSLAGLLDTPGCWARLPAAQAQSWAEKYLGPADGATARRVAQALDSSIRSAGR